MVQWFAHNSLLNLSIGFLLLASITDNMYHKVKGFSLSLLGCRFFSSCCFLQGSTWSYSSKVPFPVMANIFDTTKKTIFLYCVILFGCFAFFSSPLGLKFQLSTVLKKYACNENWMYSDKQRPSKFRSKVISICALCK